MKVPGDGPTPCKLFFMGEGPGIQEHRKGEPFVPWAPAGKEFKRFHEGIFLYREDIFVTNLVKYHVENDEDPTPEMIARDEPDLLRELEACQPEIIVPLGAPATRYFLGEDVTMDAVHGIPHPWQNSLWLKNPAVVLPIYHPALGLHSPSMQALIHYDFQQLHSLLAGEIDAWPKVDEIEKPRYEEVGPMDVYASLAGRTRCAVDTEGLPGKAWGLSFSVNAGTGWVIKKGTEALKAFKKVWARDDMVMVLHNALYDLGVLRELGVTPKRFTDTMHKAYLLCLEPQQLKLLAKRLCGMEMNSYEEITRDASTRLAVNYLTEATIHEWPPAAEELVFKENKPPRLSKKWSVNKRIDRILNDYLEKDSNVRKRWADLKKKTPELALPIELELGEMPVATLDDISQKVAVPYSGRDADATTRIDPILDQMIAAMGLEEVLEIDLNCTPMIERMQSVGMMADKEYFERFGRELGREMESLTRQISEVGGLEINPGSGDQLAHLLFHHLGLESKKMTKKKTREAVDVKVMEALRPAHPVVPLLLDFTERKKLKNTYADKLPLWVGEDGRIRSTFRQTRIPTGRLALSQPNLLAQPVRTELGRRIREGFIAPPGKLLGSWDLNQIEMRVMAHESEDENMLKVFHDPTSLGFHFATCAKIHGIRPEDVIKESTEYMMSKNVSFGIIFRISAMGLTAQMHQRGHPGWTDDDSQRMIDEWFAIYPGVKSFMEAKMAEARRYGYVRDMWGRIRYLEGIRSKVRAIRSEAERQAINFPIQSGAQGVIKLAMAGIWYDVLPAFWEERPKDEETGMECVEPILQVHDEVVLEFDEDLPTLLDPMIQAQLSGATTKLRVPITASGAWGVNWKELK